MQNFSYDFKDGLNTIKEENGFGKTTLATFIKSMFYGLDASKSEKSERKRYKPWQGGNFGGNIEFELNGKQYRIERFFGTKASDDTFKIHDLSSNLESKDFSENIGEEIFKINKEGYERSTYIPQGGIQIEMEDSLSAKLGNILESENDVNTSDEAIKKLVEMVKVYVKTGNKGLLNEKKKTLEELQRKFENAKVDTENLESKEKYLNEIKEKINTLEKERKDKQEILSKKMEQGRKQAKLETYNNILTKLKEEEQNYKECKEFFKEGIPTDEELQDLSKKALEVEKIKVEIENSDLSEEEKSTYESLKNKFYGKNVTEENINIQIMNCSKIKEIESKLQNEKSEKDNIERTIFTLQNNKKKQSESAKIIIGISAIILVIGGILVALRILAGIGVAIIGIMGIILGLMKNSSKDLSKQIDENNLKLEQLTKNINSDEEQINEMQAGIDEIVNKFDEEPAYDDKLMILSNLKTAINSYRVLENKKISKENSKQGLIVKKNEFENELIGYIIRYFETPQPYQETIEELKYNKNVFDSIAKEMEKTKKQKEEFETVNNIEELQQIETSNKDNEDDLKAKINTISLDIDKLGDEKNQIKNQIEVLENKIDENEYLETDIENLKEQISNMQERYNVLEKTKELLETAKNAFSTNYLKEMVDGFENYLKMIDDKDLSANVDINLDVNLDVNGAKKEVKYFSTGYRDLIYICIRFSLIKALFKDELPFVILDDPFVNLDDTKTEKAVDLLNQLAKEYQIIYFICNKSRM